MKRLCARVITILLATSEGLPTAVRWICSPIPDTLPAGLTYRGYSCISWIPQEKELQQGL